MISRLSKWRAYVIPSRLLVNALPPPSPICTSLLPFFDGDWGSQQETKEIYQLNTQCPHFSPFYILLQV